jgi:hypothetical protein
VPLFLWRAGISLFTLAGMFLEWGPSKGGPPARGGPTMMIGPGKDRSRLLCPELCPRAANLWPTPANTSQLKNKNPPVSCKLTEGPDRAARFVRAALFQLSYPPVP